VEIARRQGAEQVRKAEKSGLQAVSGHLELLDGFTGSSAGNMRDLGTPVYGKNFFRNILETFPDSTRIISVVKDGKTMASGLLTWYKETLEVPWASSNRDYREFCPNNLLYWEAIKFAIRNGSAKFDFRPLHSGRGDISLQEAVGAEPVPLHWQYLLGAGRALPELNPKNPKFEAAIPGLAEAPGRHRNATGTVDSAEHPVMT